MPSGPFHSQIYAENHSLLIDKMMASKTVHERRESMLCLSLTEHKTFLKQVLSATQVAKDFGIMLVWFLLQSYLCKYVCKCIMHTSRQGRVKFERHKITTNNLPKFSEGGGYLDLSSDGDVPFCPKNWYP